MINWSRKLKRRHGSNRVNATKLVAQGKERVQVTEDYSTAASEIYTKRLQELG